MVKTINGWLQIKNGNGFVKKVGEDLFDVVRIEDSNDSSENIYYENYDLVNLKDATEKTISRHGDYDHFLKLKTDEEKVIYLAFSGYNPSQSCTCQSYEQITNILQEEGVIAKGETLPLQ